MSITTFGHRGLRARKRHTCDACHGTIEPGQRYAVRCCADGGAAWTWREHLPCGDLVRALLDRHEMEDGVDSGGLVDLVADRFSHDGRAADVIAIAGPLGEGDESVLDLCRRAGVGE